jgi:hypothetical protein
MQGPAREVFQAEALSWLASREAAPETSVVTSLPDVSEVPALGFDAWRAWFIDAARTVMRWVPESGVSIFFQSDIRHEGRWIDKGYLVQRAAEEEGKLLLWHKIVCRKPAGTISHGRATYSHLLCFASSVSEAVKRPGPDVLPDTGHMPWSRAMGVEACRLACAYLKHETQTRTVVDPFCGQGTVLAVANSLDLDAIGIDLSAKRCRAARRLVLVGDQATRSDTREPPSVPTESETFSAE